jgi:hypothetical protein
MKVAVKWASRPLGRPWRSSRPNGRKPGFHGPDSPRSSVIAALTKALWYFNAPVVAAVYF